MELKVIGTPGLDELGPACHESESARAYMSIECCHVYVAVSDLPGFHSKEAISPEDSKGVSDGIETDYDCGEANNTPEDLFFGLHFC